MAHWFSSNTNKNAHQLFSFQAVSIGALVVAGLFGALLFFDFCIRPFPLAAPEKYWIKPGQNAQQVAFDLSARGLLPFPRLWLLWGKWRGKIHSIAVGEYALSPEMTPRDLMLKLETADVIKYQVRLGEGWSFSKIKRLLSMHPALTLDLPEPILVPLMCPGIPYSCQLSRSSSSFDFFSFNDLPVHDWIPFHSPEGLFFPDTYAFTWGYSSRALLTKAHRRLWKYLEKAWESRDLGLPYQDPYQALIAASIIEKETGLAEEKPKVAGVLVRRLLRKMPLQMDPTIIYGLGDAYEGHLTHEAVRWDTPYNTYVRTGLPPTPIGLVSPQAIDAALHPDAGDSLYFVAKGDGTHEFSSTLEAHNRAISRWIQQQKSKTPI